MHIDVAATIREVLDDMEAVYITGIGTIKLKHISAYFSDNGTTLSPPQMVLDVNDSITPNNPLIQAISNNYGLSKDEASNVVSSFNKKLITNLVNYKKVYLKGIALIKRTDNGKVKVEPITKDLYNYYNGLNKVQAFSVIKSTKAVIEKSDNTPVLVTPIKEVTPDRTNGVVAPDSSLKTKNTVTTPPKSSYVAPTKETPPLINAPSNQLADVSKSEVKTNEAARTSFVTDKSPQVTPVYQFDEKKPSILWPLILATALILIALLCYKACSNYTFSGNNDKGSHSGMNIEEVDVLDGVTPTDSISAEALSEMRNNKGSLIPISGKCKIITGVFGRNVNAYRMRDLVRNEGYEVYTESLGDYTRVGLEFNCNEETDLESFLQEVRREIAAKAWYLDPSLYVEYE
ncbi:hypothetical protein N9L92_01450 [Saprospiraceae bacterium]|nr:hypothetical protein [Saprospiraceae bacterium]